MQAHRTETTVSGDGSITLHNVPFVEVEEVEVIVLPRLATNEGGADRKSLRGSVRKSDRPFESASEAGEWDAA
ncbi:hypothetical protein BH23BAC4_BH23BAC4_03440 [soil metagenome]